MLFAISGVVLGAVYMLWMYQRVMFGPLNNEENKRLTDLSQREILVFAPLLALMVFMGLYPRPFLVRMEKAVEVALTRMASVQKVAVRPVNNPGAVEMKTAALPAPAWELHH